MGMVVAYEVNSFSIIKHVRRREINWVVAIKSLKIYKVMWSETPNF
jgi:hypothetical protein